MKAVGSYLLALLVLLSGKLYAQDGNWFDDPVISSDQCAKLDYPEVVDFLTTYYYPTFGASSSHDESGEDMMQAYAIASSLILRSQICMAEALELKEITDKLKKEQAIVASGTSMSRKEIKKQRKLSAEASTQIEAAAEKDKELTPEQRKTFSIGAAAYLAGTHATAELFQKVKNFAQATKEEATGGGFMKKSFSDGFNKIKSTVGTANTVRVISKGMKDHTKQLITTSKFLMDYSKQEDMDLPSEATANVNAVDWV